MKISKKKFLSIIIVIILICIIIATYFTGLIIIPRSTKLSVTPSNFVIESGSNLVFTARLESDNFVLTGKPLYWSASEGSFDKTVGEMVTYIAPTVVENKTVTITVSFQGDREYQGVKVTVTGIIYPRKAVKTTLTVNPPNFEIEVGKSISLTATLLPLSASPELISWSLEGPGDLSARVGTSTTYTAPKEISEKTTVKIIVNFPGTSEYQSSTFVCEGIIHPAGVILKKSTTLTIEPTMSTLRPSEKIVLSATLKDSEGNILPDKLLIWELEGPGDLSTRVGVSTTYTAPKEISERITVKVTVKFEGDEYYSSSNMIAIIEIIPVSVKLEEIVYVLTFDEMSLRKVRIEGPIKIHNIEVTKVIAENVDIKGFNLSRIGLSSSTAEIPSVELYLTSLMAYSRELGKTLTIQGNEKVSYTYETLTLEKGTIKLIRLSAEKTSLKEVKMIGEYIGGSEPYVPSIINTPEAELLEGYSFTASSYNELVEKVHLFTLGKGIVKDITIVHPITYHLDRVRNSYTFQSKWTARASNSTFINAQAYIIYINFKVLNLGPLIFTGEDMPYLMGMEKGYGGTITDGSIHVVYATLDQMFFEKIVIDIVLT
ncbi:MAG: hypothetical protein NZ893_02025 [Candidatus Aenigmarchaeota archaeon]|nr:hypothetical protein [Candidatus Aenigmarchaeota archaeon]